MPPSESISWKSSAPAVSAATTIGYGGDWSSAFDSPSPAPASSMRQFTPPIQANAPSGGGDFNFASILSPLIGLVPLLTARAGKKASGVARAHSSATMPAVAGGIPLWMFVGGGIVLLGGMMLFVGNRD